MATYYLHGTSGSDAVGVTGLVSTAPLKTIARLFALHPTLNGDTINLAGLFVEATTTTFTNPTDATFQQWSGQTAYEVRGLREPIADGGTWVLSAGNTYKISIGVGKTVGPVVYGWDHFLYNSVRKAGYLTLGAAPIAGALAAADTYYYDTVAGLLYAWFVGNADPNTPAWAPFTDNDLPMWADATLVSGLVLTGSTRCTITGGTWRGFLGNTSQRTILVDNDCVVDGCTVYDAETHGINCLGSPTCSGVIQNCSLYGAGDKAATPSLVSFYNAFGNVAGARIRNNTFHCYTLLKSTGVIRSPDRAATDQYCGAALSHTDGAGGHVVSDIEFTGNRVYFYENPAGAISDISNPGVDSDLTTYAGHVNRLSDNVVTGIRGQMGWSTAVAARRNFFGTGKPPTGSTTPNQVLIPDGAYLEANTFNADLSPDVAEGRNLLQIPAGILVRAYNNTFHVITPSVDNFQALINFISDAAYNAGVAGWRFIGSGNSFSFQNTNSNKYLCGATNAPASNWQLTGNEFYNIYESGANGGYGLAAPAPLTFAAFKAANDATATNLDPGFASAGSTDPAFAGALALTSALLLTANKQPTLTLHASLGINGYAWDGTAGSWQPRPTFGNARTRGSHRGRLLWTR